MPSADTLSRRAEVFVSYARSDGAEIARALRQRLEAEGIPLWQDITSIEGGRDWWQQIVDALQHATFMVLVLTPAAICSPSVRREWRLARQRGVCVYPVLGIPGLSLELMPRWMREAHAYDPSIDEQWERLLNDLMTTPRATRVPFMAEQLPEGFVDRPQEFGRLKRLLLDESRGEPIAITAALRGAGGYGKTTLARALCYDDDIQEAFDDGILWVTLGEHPDNLTDKVSTLIEILDGKRPGYTSLEAAVAAFAELIADKDILLVLDDVWSAAHARPFLSGGTRCARLITTRNLDTVPERARDVRVDAMEAGEAVRLLAGDLDAADNLRPAFRQLAERLGCWPLLLRLVHKALTVRVHQTRQPLNAAVASVTALLDRKGLTAFDPHDPQARGDAVGKTLEVSLELLAPHDFERFRELAIFPEDVDVPLSTVARFWHRTGGLVEIEAEELCCRFHVLSLLLDLDLATRVLRLHDVIRAYLRSQVSPRIENLHGMFLEAHRPIPDSAVVAPASQWADLPEDDPYLWEHLGSHLVDAGRGEDLVALVKDLRYIARKAILRGSNALERDMARASSVAPTDDQVRALERGCSQAAHLLNRCESESDVEAVLLSRFDREAELQDSLTRLARVAHRPRIIADGSLPDLPARALERTLEGHGDSVRGCAFSSDGARIASASYDRTLKVWDARTGELERTIEAHGGAAFGCAFSPDSDHIASASYDRTLKVWNARTGELERRIEAHCGAVLGCAFNSDGGRIVSASSDRTLKVWNTHTGEPEFTLEGHGGSVSGCAFSPDGTRIVSASDDRTLKIWNARTGKLERTLVGHDGWVTGCAFSPDGARIVSAADDRTLKVWDTLTGHVERTLEGHRNRVRACAFSPDGTRIVSASYDRTLKVWSACTGKLQRTMRGHGNWVRGCAFSPDGARIVSASDDRTLKVWSASTGEPERPLDGHNGAVFGCAFSPDGARIVSASEDRTLKIWHARTGELEHTIEAHGGRVFGCAFSPDGAWIVSAFSDRTLRVWHAPTGELKRTLGGHGNWIRGCAFSPDSTQIASASDDGTLKVWNARTGVLERTLEGHGSWTRGCAFSPDGARIVSASSDWTLKVWRTRTGELERTMAGHGGPVFACVFSSDGTRIASASADRTLRVWDARTGDLERTLEGHDGGVDGCAFSPDGALIVSASDDRKLKVWSVRTGSCLTTLHVDGALLCCAWSPDGERIIAGGVAGLYRLRFLP